MVTVCVPFSYLRKRIIYVTLQILFVKIVFFTNRVVNMWNSLPNTVMHAEYANVFENKIG